MIFLDSLHDVFRVGDYLFHVSPLKANLLTEK